MTILPNLHDVSSKSSNNISLDDTDWSAFRFPPRPPKRWDGPEEFQEPRSLAPTWAKPPREVRTWHLDLDRLLIIHPVQRKKIDLSRVNTRRRLIQLTQLIKTQQESEDVASLWRSLDDACTHAWSMSLPEMLALSPDNWEWPSFNDMVNRDSIHDFDNHNDDE